MLRLLLVIAVLSTFNGCSLFSPRDSEYPLPESVANNFNFDQLFDQNSTHKFRNLELPELFTSSALYEDFNSGFSTYEELLSHLERIGRSSSFTVQWTQGATEFKDTKLFLVNFRYVVNRAGQSVLTGRADFTLVDISGWQIQEWKDIPDGPEKSFFSPK